MKWVNEDLRANPTKWLKKLKQLVDNLPTNCLIVFDHFVKLALKGLKSTHIHCVIKHVRKSHAKIV